MNTDQIRQVLIEKQEQLTRRVRQIESELRSPGSQDSEERATESENHEVLERLDDAERSELEQIQKALARIENGRYTVCSRCRGPITEKRLEALPYTDVCVSCAS